jgi:hypothetical protein
VQVIEQPEEAEEEPIAAAPPPPPAEPEQDSGWVAPQDPEPAEEEATRTKGSAAPAVEMAAEPDRDPALEPAPSLGRVRLGAGSGWLRSVDVGAQTLERSALSYSLGPTSLFELGGEVLIPGIDLGAAIDLGLRPVRYFVDTGTGEASDPRGLIFDMHAVLLYRLTFGSESSPALMPQLGARMSLATIEAHPQDVIPAATTIAIIGGVALRIPIGALLEVEAGGHGGWIPLYSERPTDTGKSKGGFTAGGHLSLRIWLFAGFGLSLDNRIGFDRVSFEERPSRTVPPEEIDTLENASVGLFELKSSLAVTYRF